MKNTQNITLDLTNPNVTPPPVIYAKQGDSGSREVCAKIIDNGIDTTISAPCRVYFSGISGGSPCYITGMISNGNITFIIPQTATQKSGTAKAEVQILNSSNSNELIATMNFDLIIKPTAYNVKSIVGTNGGNLADQYVDNAVAKHNSSDTAHQDIRQGLSSHNTDTSAHKDIRTSINQVSTSVSTLHDTVDNRWDSFIENKIDVGKQIEDISDDINFLYTRASGLGSSIADIKDYIGYTSDDVLGLCVDYENKTFTRLAGALIAGTPGNSVEEIFNHFPMYSGRKRCIVFDDGVIYAVNDGTKYIANDSTSSEIPIATAESGGLTGDYIINGKTYSGGTKTQVMVYQPAFYYRVVPLKLEKSEHGYHIRKANYYVSATPKEGFKLHPAFYDENGKPVDYILFSAYEGCMYDVSAGQYISDNTDTSTTIGEGDLLCSLPGMKPISGKYKPLTRVTLETMAQNHGNGWHLENIKALAANQLLMMIEYGTLNMQTAIGQGIVSISDNSAYNCASQTGSTASLCNATGQAASTVNIIGDTSTTYTDSGKVAISYRGMENPWGNIRKHPDGINIWGDGSMDGGQIYIADDYNYSESKHDGNYKATSLILPNTSGYISAMGYNSEYDWLFIPSEVSGTSALPVGDYCYSSCLNGYRYFENGGWAFGDKAGLYYWGISSTDNGRNVGSRLIYVPTAKI